MSHQRPCGGRSDPARLDLGRSSLQRLIACDDRALHGGCGEFVEAVTVLERAAKLSGNDAAINEHLGDAYWNSGRLRDARYACAVASQAVEGDAAKRLASKVDVGMAPR